MAACQLCGRKKFFYHPPRLEPRSIRVRTPGSNPHAIKPRLVYELFITSWKVKKKKKKILQYCHKYNSIKRYNNGWKIADINIYNSRQFEWCGFLFYVLLLLHSVFIYPYAINGTRNVIYRVQNFIKLAETTLLIILQMSCIISTRKCNSLSNACSTNLYLYTLIHSLCEFFHLQILGFKFKKR